MFINQTSVSPILVIALQQSGGGLQRLIEALVGGGVAVVISVLLFPAAPLPLLREAAQAAFGALHAAMAHLDEIVDGRALVDQRWMLGAGEHIYEQLGGLIGARFTAAEIVRLAPRRWRLRPAVRAADDRLTHLNLLANAVLSLLRSTVGGLGVEPTLPRSFARASTSSPRHSARSPRTGKPANPRRWPALPAPPGSRTRRRTGPAPTRC